MSGQRMFSGRYDGTLIAGQQTLPYTARHTPYQIFHFRLPAPQNSRIVRLGNGLVHDFFATPLSSGRQIRYGNGAL